MDDFCGDVCLWLVLVALSPLEEEDVEVEDVLCAAVTPGGGCVVRARDERRGDMGMEAMPCAGQQERVAIRKRGVLRRS